MKRCKSEEKLCKRNEDWIVRFQAFLRRRARPVERPTWKFPKAVPSIPLPKPVLAVYSEKQWIHNSGFCFAVAVVLVIFFPVGDRLSLCSLGWSWTSACWVDRLCCQIHLSGGYCKEVFPISSTQQGAVMLTGQKILLSTLVVLRMWVETLLGSNNPFTEVHTRYPA